jgi:hypothetical protein
LLRATGIPTSQKSLEAYQVRVAAGGWPEEVYYSMYMVARLKEVLGHPVNEVVEAYSRAWEFRPERLEAVFHAMRKLREQSRWVLALSLRGGSTTESWNQRYPLR